MSLELGHGIHLHRLNPPSSVILNVTEGGVRDLLYLSFKPAQSAVQTGIPVR